MKLRAPDMMRGVLTVMLLGAFQTALFWLFQFEVPSSNRDLVVFMLGQLSGFAGAAVAYYLGTSKSSNDKDELLRLPPPEPKWDYEPDPLDPARDRTRVTSSQYASRSER